MVCKLNSLVLWEFRDGYSYFFCSFGVLDDFVVEEQIDYGGFFLYNNNNKILVYDKYCLFYYVFYFLYYSFGFMFDVVSIVLFN